MGQNSSCFQCCKREKRESGNKKDLGVGLMRDRYCYQCRRTYISNIEYNKHIPTCSGICGDM